MKKYLMMALAVAALATSCTKNDFESMSQAEIDKAKYDQAFLRYVGGTIAPNQDWGFGVTRADGEFANHVGAYPDANMWTSKGFYAPDPLTHAQKLRAQYYFQMNQIVNPNQPDNGTKDFFMQQVYDGGTDPMAGKSLEKYLAADNNTYIESGEHMDHLTCGPDHTHTFNFNNGTCSTNPNVADRDQMDVNDVTKQHSDEIQLMLNTKTSCFGYANSDASCVRDDRWTLVSAATIDAFCDNDPGFAAWLAGKLNEGEEDVKCDDQFHRSFIGFDFDQLPDDVVYAGTEEYEYGKPEYNYQPHLVSKTYSESDYYRYDLYGAKYHYLKSEQNQYCGEFKNIDPQPDEADAKDLLDAGWLPVINSANKKWVKIGGCNDGYYSDWIVTFLPATSGDAPETLRIIAEDLSATEASDFDFNDVVLDVDCSTTPATITLVAAGGTLPLYIQVAGTDKSFEVHELFAEANPNAGITVKTMINTGMGPQVPVLDITTKLNVNIANAAEAKDKLLLKVEKNGVLQEMEAPVGEPASKLAVDTSFKILKERQSIKGEYPLFVEWATENNFTSKWW